MTSFSRFTIYTKMKSGDFPKQVRLSTRRVAWRLSEIEEWMSCHVEDPEWRDETPDTEAKLAKTNILPDEGETTPGSSIPDANNAGIELFGFLGQRPTVIAAKVPDGGIKFTYAQDWSEAVQFSAAGSA